MLSQKKKCFLYDNKCFLVLLFSVYFTFVVYVLACISKLSEYIILHLQYSSKYICFAFNKCHWQFLYYKVMCTESVNARQRKTFAKRKFIVGFHFTDYMFS